MAAGAKLFQYWEPVDHRHLSTYRIFRSLLHLARSTPTEKKSGYCTHSGFFLRILPLTVSFLVFSPITYRLNVSSGFKLRRTIVSAWKRSLSFWHPNSLRQEPRPLLSLWRVGCIMGDTGSTTGKRSCHIGNLTEIERPATIEPDSIPPPICDMKSYFP